MSKWALRTSWLRRAAIASLALAGALGCNLDTLVEDLKKLNLEQAPAAPVVATVDFPRPVAQSVAIEGHALVAFEDKDVAVFDMRSPGALKSAGTSQSLYPPLVTPGRVVSIHHDPGRGLVYLADTTGTVTLVDFPSGRGASVIGSVALPALAGKITSIARIGDLTYALAGTSVQPLRLQNGGTLVAQPAVVLASPPSVIAPGAASVYLGYASGDVEMRIVDLATGAMGAPLAVGVGGAVKSIASKGTKAFVLASGTGLSVIDFGARPPKIVATVPELSDPLFAELYGRTLLVRLERGYLATVDLSILANPRVVTNTREAVTFASIVGGNLLYGTGKKGSVAGVYPVVAGRPPAITAKAFPQDAQIPVTFSKPIDPASVSAAKLSCNGIDVPGAVLASPDALSARFQPAALLPAGAACSLDASAVKDALGLAAVTGGAPPRFDFTVSSVAPASIVNPGSKMGHTIDGAFTGFASAPAAQPTQSGAVHGVEWSDVTAAKGVYTYFYADFDGTFLWLMNDWFYNEERVDPDCYNQFNVWTGGGSEQWNIRAYGDQHVEVRLNGDLLDPFTSGVVGGASHAPSPNLAEPHTMYELRIRAKAGTWGVQLHDPGPTFSCHTLEGDPTSLSGSLTGASGQSGASIGQVKPAAPTAPVLVAPAAGATGVPLVPVLTWQAGPGSSTAFVGYRVEVSLDAAFSAGGAFGLSTYMNALQVPSGILAGQTAYFWRVTAWNAAGSAVSAPSSFTTAAAPPAGSFTLYVGHSPGGQVGSTDSPQTLLCPAAETACSAAYGANTTVTLTALPAPGYSFAGWLGQCSGASLTVPVLMNTVKGCYAQFSTPTSTGNLVPGITAVSPAEFDVGLVADQQVDITGTDFVPGGMAILAAGSVYQELATLYQSPTSLIAVIPASYFAAAAVLDVAVLNPPPGGGISPATVKITVGNPAVVPDAGPEAGAGGAGGSGGIDASVDAGAGGAAGSGGIDAGVDAGAGGSGGIDASVDAGAGGSGGIDASVDAGAGGAAGMDAGVDAEAGPGAQLLYHGAPCSLAVSGSDLYIGLCKSGGIVRVATMGGPSTPVGATDLDVPAGTIAVDTTYVYYATATTIQRIERTGLVDTKRADATGVSYLTANASGIYWAENALSTAASIKILPTASSSPIPVYSGIPYLTGLTFAWNDIVWTQTGIAPTYAASGLYETLQPATPLVSGLNTSAMADGSGTHVAYFNKGDLYWYSSASGRQLLKSAASGDGILSDGDAILYYGQTVGIWRYQAAAWTQLTAEAVNTAVAQDGRVYFMTTSGDVKAL